LCLVSLSFPFLSFPFFSFVCCFVCRTFLSLSFVVAVFDPHASKLLGKAPLEIKEMQDEGKITELESATAAVEGRVFLVELWQGQGGWTAKDVFATDN